MAYEDSVADYYSQFEPGAAKGLDYPAFEVWSLGSPTPTQKNVLDTHTNAHYCTATDTGMSNHQRYTREISGVGTRDTVIFDHTHKMMANHCSKTRRLGNAVQTFMVGSGKVAAVNVLFRESSTRKAGPEPTTHTGLQHIKHNIYTEYKDLNIYQAYYISLLLRLDPLQDQ